MDPSKTPIPGFLSKFIKEGDEIQNLVVKSDDLRKPDKVGENTDSEKANERVREIKTSIFETRKAIVHLELIDDDISSVIEKYKAHLAELIAALNDAQKQLEKLEAKALKEGHELIDEEDVQKHVADFIERQKQRWRETPYGLEDISKLFSEKHLKDLNLADYILLMQRFPGEMVTHVTRQGIRDHADLADHSTNIGSMHDGFKEILKGKRLHSMLKLMILGEMQDEEIMKRILNNPRNRTDAIRRVENLTSEPDVLFKTKFGGQGSFSDQAAIHFAAEHVLDKYYGSERGNEIFLVFPSVFIASQFKFMNPHKSSHDLLPMADDRSTHFGDLGKADKFTDLFVWTEAQKGIDMNAGIVFIPERAAVDAKTGSQYELDETNTPLETDEFSEVCEKILAHSDAEKEWSKLTRRSLFTDSIENVKVERFLAKINISMSPKIKEVILKNFIKSARDPFHEWGNLKSQWLRKYDRSDKRDRMELFYFGVLYKRADRTISSKEYWEDYFEKNPDKKPGKIVYYDGDPTTALHQWREENGIAGGLRESVKMASHAGFPENLVHTKIRRSSLKKDPIENELNVDQSPEGLLLKEDREAIAAVLREIIDRRFPE